MVIGKIIGGLLGLAVAGLVGLVVGVLVGHLFDRGLGSAMRFASPENLRRIQQGFFRTTFLLSGHLAKADGRISQQEVDHTEQLFNQLGLSADQRREAIALFKEGAGADFSLESTIADYLAVCGQQPQLRQTLLLFLISLAHADQAMEPAEHAILSRIASELGMAASTLEQLVQMAQAQTRFHRGGGQAPGATGGASALDAAYTALGVDSSVSDRDLKRAYRRLMSENHPDKLIAKGVPESMIELATERSQEISTAYELVRKHRGMR
jgi:DnaJ like chaperone protein